VADLSEICDYFALTAASAVYPNGTGSPSAAGIDVRIFSGWPMPDQLDLDLGGKMLSGTPPMPVARPNGPVANVSIYPMPGTGIAVPQILDETYTITPAAISLGVTVANTVITVTGQPGAGEYLTLVIDDAVVCSQGGTTTQALLAALATQAQGFGYGATATATTLTIVFGHSMVVRQGGQAVLGKVTHRQRQSIMVTVWAPTHVARSALAKAIDGLIKQANKVTMPDTSQALVFYNRTTQSDEQQMATIYRRDLIYDVEYATVEEFPGYVVTSTQVSIAKPDNAAIATAIA
jgi:hypothetical protein